MLGGKSAFCIFLLNFYLSWQVPYTFEALSLSQSQWCSTATSTTPLVPLLTAKLWQISPKVPLGIKFQIFRLTHYKCFRNTRSQARSIFYDLFVLIPSRNHSLQPVFTFLCLLWFNFSHSGKSLLHIREKHASWEASWHKPPKTPLLLTAGFGVVIIPFH